MGWDLTAGPARPTAVALLSTEGELVGLEQARGDGDLLALARAWRPRLVAIDSPLGLPLGLCCLEQDCPCTPALPGAGRVCERALRREGIGCFYTTKRSIIKGMVYRAMALRRALEGMGLEVVEVYPHATRVRLWGRRLPRKTTPRGVEVVVEGLQALGLRLAHPPGASLTHDDADALLAAWTGLLWLQGRAEALGLPEEGQIVVPRGHLT